jgi:hypothetical protein
VVFFPVDAATAVDQEVGAGDPGRLMELLVLSAAPGSSTEDGLRLLASLGGAEGGDARHRDGHPGDARPDHLDGLSTVDVQA